ncbi:hypothetical protein QA641_38105 [Bradyrhizobium sp. CB1650]|uniref:hypothetical protein n=1 Tax=Bradyrhizobium sp. CB1650 TaxID=3039153 RepID=UPI002435A504|nr:hypothetical protein [Bradyrhizobium sp. CB1650]WGD51242.1 hypothetical protein QA641_38105 [Bradyrhizobium sp. CB1650]
MQPIFRRKHGNKPALPMRAQNYTRIAGKTPRLVPSERRMQRSMNAQRAKLLPDLWTLLERNEEQIFPWFQNVATLRGSPPILCLTISPITSMAISAPSVPLSSVSKAWAKLFS